MKKNIAITETYLSSVFKLDNQSKKLTLSTITQLSENPKSFGALLPFEHEPNRNPHWLRDLG